MNFSETDNNLFSRLLTTWNSREDLRVNDAPLAERVEATIAIDHARKALAHSPRFAHAA